MRFYEAYHEWLPVGRHPVFMLFLRWTPSLLTSNVHPTKREVRFSNDLMLYDLMFHHIRNCFRDGRMCRSWVNLRDEDPVKRRKIFSPDSPIPPFPLSSSTLSNAAVKEAPVLVADAPIHRFTDSSIRILGQFQKVYLLAEQGEELLLIDQHAAAERVPLREASQQSKLAAPKRSRS